MTHLLTNTFTDKQTWPTQHTAEMYDGGWLIGNAVVSRIYTTQLQLSLCVRVCVYRNVNALLVVVTST